MRYIPYLILVILVMGCPEETNPPEDPPPGVILKPYNGDTSRIDRGTRAVEGNQYQIRIEWHPLHEQYLVSQYQVFRSNHNDSLFEQIAVRNVAGVEEDSFFIDTRVGFDTTYYYFVIAKDSKNNISDTTVYFLQENFGKYIVDFELAKKAVLFYPLSTDTAIGGKFRFRWIYTATPPLRYIVKLYANGNQVIWSAYKQPGGFDVDGLVVEYLTIDTVSYAADTSKSFNSDVTVTYFNRLFFNSDRLKKGTYSWRVDCNFPGNRSSRSSGSAFSVTKD